MSIMTSMAGDNRIVKNNGKGEFLKIEGENALMVAFRAYANRHETVKASERIKDRLLARDEANDGWTGLAPYGFRNVRKRLSDGKVGIILDRRGTIGTIGRHPAEYPVLLLIAELSLQLRAYNAVAMELNRRKIPSPDGGSNWYPLCDPHLSGPHGAT
jgi:hypothetical protein